MATERFDRLVKSLSTGGTRRGLLRLLAALPVAGGLLTRLEEVVQGQGNSAVVGGGGRRRRRKARHRHDPGNDKDNRKGKRQGKGPCATVGQTPRRGNRRHCCAGLNKDATGRCATTRPCTGLYPTDDLQAAIDAAAPGATLTLCPGTWALTSGIRTPRNLTLVGAGAGQTVLDGGGNPIRVLQIAPGASVTVQDLTIAKGVSTAGFEGGGIYNEGTLRLLGVTVTGNKSEFAGGIYNNGTLTLAAGSRVSDNTADFEGGGIYNDGTVTLEGGSNVSGNAAGSSGGGIYISSGLATLKDGSLVSGNTTGSEGGGIYNFNGILTLAAGSRVSGNTASFAGGGISNLGSVTLEGGSRVSGNTAGSFGGGIYNDGGVVTLVDSNSVTGNSPDNCEPDISTCT